MPRPGFEPTSVELHLQPGTLLIQDALPTELPRLQLHREDKNATLNCSHPAKEKASKHHGHIIKTEFS